MKPFVVYSALGLAILFLTGAAIAGAELLLKENFLTNPKLKPALGFLVTGLMFLAIGLRGWRARQRSVQSGNQSSTGRPLT